MLCENENGVSSRSSSGYPKLPIASSEHKANGRKLNNRYWPTDLLNHSISTVTTFSASNHAKKGE